MSTDDKDDLTRIEDLSDFLHEGEEEEDSQESSGVNEAFANEATDPNIEIPAEFYLNDESEDTADFYTSSDESDDFSNASQDNAQDFNMNRFDMDGEDLVDENELNDQIDEELTAAFEKDNGQEITTEDEANDFNNEDFNESEFSDNEFATLVTDEDMPELPHETPSFDNASSLAVDTPQTTSTVKTPIERPQIFEQEIKKIPETFAEVKDFASNMALGDMGQEGNPPYSIIVKNLRYQEEVDEIIDLLTQYQILKDNPQKQKAKDSLFRGALLIPRLSEYVAILLCHKLRSFSATVLMGLTEEINPTMANSKQNKGLANRSTLANERQHHFEFDKEQLQLDKIITTTMNSLPGHEIVHYLGIVTEKTTVDMESFANDHSLEFEIINNLEGEISDSLMSKHIRKVNQAAANSDKIDVIDENDSPEIHRYTLSDIYQSLVENLKLKAQTMKANAIVGINFSITPILVSGVSASTKYHITCTGNIVWANKI